MNTLTGRKDEIVKPVYFANWSDLFGFPIAYGLLRFVHTVSWITPNLVTIVAFLLYAVGSLLLFIPVTNHLLIAAVLLPAAFILDDLDGQLARLRKEYSDIGNYLDKVLDVLKIYIVTISLSIATYGATHDATYIFLGFTACFFFMYRYYIKLETMFAQLEKDRDYLTKSSRVRSHLAQTLTHTYTQLSKSLTGSIRAAWQKNRILFLVDEGEFAILTALFAILNQLPLWMWILTISQVVIALLRFVERGYQVANNSSNLLLPMRK